MADSSDILMRAHVRAIRALAPELDDFWHRLVASATLAQDNEHDLTSAEAFEKLLEELAHDTYWMMIEATKRYKHENRLIHMEAVFFLFGFIGSVVWGDRKDGERGIGAIFWKHRSMDPDIVVKGDNLAREYLAYQLLGRRSSTAAKYFRVDDTPCFITVPK
jgi:hypothetical protein